ncbi:unnamed protein product [Caenorhabditis angaria]|uniref:Uncharacterized protein n=1 Tax=Caenorhabditis angaria TaxID=860376 RepID=A0A9P1MVG1_9PELO|nr:unnamed protein product [Caenorhabditis angaria]
MKVTKDTSKRARKVSETRLSPKDELFRETIRVEIDTRPFYSWSNSQLTQEATEIGKALSKNVAQVKKALLNRKNFVERKIMDSLINLEITDPNSPKIKAVSEELNISHPNVFYVASQKMSIITKKIFEKNTAKA